MAQVIISNSDIDNRGLYLESAELQQFPFTLGGMEGAQQDWKKKWPAKHSTVWSRKLESAWRKAKNHN